MDHGDPHADFNVVHGAVAHMRGAIASSQHVDSSFAGVLNGQFGTAGMPAEQFWPHLSALINKICNDMLPQLLDDSKPLWMGDIMLQK